MPYSVTSTENPKAKDNGSVTSPLIRSKQTRRRQSQEAEEHFQAQFDPPLKTMNINTRLLALALWLECGFAFQVQRQAPATMKFFVTGNNPFREIDIDIELAEDCAKNFGKHSVEEIEQCRDGE